MSLDSLNNIGQKARVRWDQASNTYVQDGEKPGNVFSRVMDWATRSEDRIKANKATARQFIDDLRAEYGDEVAQFATKQLSAHLAKGRPLSKRRVEIIREKARTTEERIKGANSQKLGEVLKELTLEGLRDHGFGEIHRSDRKLVPNLEEKVKTAIESDPAYSKSALSSSQDFQLAFDSVIRKTVGDYLQEKKNEMSLLPNLADAALKGGRFPGVTALEEEATKLYPGNDHAALNAQHAFETHLNALEMIAERLKETNPNDAAANAQDRDIVKDLTGNLESLRHAETALSEARAKAKTDREREILDAALKDADALGKTMRKALGLDTLSEADLTKILDARRGFSDADEMLMGPQSHLVQIFSDPQGLPRQLRAQKETFDSIEAQGPARKALDTLSQIANDNLESYNSLLGRLKPFSAQFEVMARDDRLLRNAKQGGDKASQMATVREMAAELGRVQSDPWTLTDMLQKPMAMPADDVAANDMDMDKMVREEASSLRMSLKAVLSDAEDLAPLNKITAAVGDRLEAASKEFEAELNVQVKSNAAARNRGAVVALAGDLQQAELVKEQAGKGIEASQRFVQGASIPETYEQQKQARRNAEASIQRNVDRIDAQATEAKRLLGLDSLSPDDYRKVMDARGRFDEIDALLREPQNHLLELHAHPERLSKDLEDVRDTFAGVQASERGRWTLENLSDAVGARRQEHLTLRQSMEPFKQQLDAMASANQLLGRLNANDAENLDEQVETALAQLERIAGGGGGSRMAVWIRDAAASLRTRLSDAAG